MHECTALYRLVVVIYVVLCFCLGRFDILRGNVGQMPIKCRTNADKIPDSADKMPDSADKVPNGLGRIIDCMKECYLKIRNETLPMSIGYTSAYLGLVACFIILFY